MMNMNLWVRLTEEQYAKLVSIYGEEQALKFAISLEISRFIRKVLNPVSVDHITPDINEETA